jgi:hypothetical protein
MAAVLRKVKFSFLQSSFRTTTLSRRLRAPARPHKSAKTGLSAIWSARAEGTPGDPRASRGVVLVRTRLDRSAHQVAARRYPRMPRALRQRWPAHRALRRWLEQADVGDGRPPAPFVTSVASWGAIPGGLIDPEGPGLGEPPPRGQPRPGAPVGGERRTVIHGRHQGRCFRY